MIVCAASGLYYYFKVIRSMYGDKPAENAEPVQVPAISGVMLAAFSIVIVLGGLMPLFLAPMAGVTDPIFRTICKELGVDVMVTEFVSAEGILQAWERNRCLLYTSRCV